MKVSDAAEVMHLRLQKGMLKGAKIAFVPGDPGRVEHIVRTFSKEATHLASNREYTTWLGQLDGCPVLCTSTGIGGPSTSIAIEELARLGVRTFIRVGTTGSIQRQVQLGDIVITTGSVRLDGASRHYAPIEYPAVANYEALDALVKASKRQKVTAHIGITASTDTFYPGQNREDTYSKHIIRELRGSLEEWQKLNVLNYEMESSTLFHRLLGVGPQGWLCSRCSRLSGKRRSYQENGREICRGERHCRGGWCGAVPASRRSVGDIA